MIESASPPKREITNTKKTMNTKLLLTVMLAAVMIPSARAVLPGPPQPWFDKTWKPGGVMTKTQEYTATVTAINLRRREATLRLPDDTTRTFAVRENIDLSKRKVGEKMAVRVTVAVAISVEKP